MLRRIAENSKENSEGSVPELPRTTPGLEWKAKELAPTPVHILPKLTLPLKQILPRVPRTSVGTPIVEDEIASSAGNQLERDWIRAVSVVPNADPFPNGVVEGFKQSDVAVPTQEQQKKQPHHLDCHHFYSISPVYLGPGFEVVLRLTASSRNAPLSCKR